MQCRSFSSSFSLPMSMMTHIFSLSSRDIRLFFGLLACLLDDEVQLHYDSSESNLRSGSSSSENTLEEKTEKFNIEYK